MERVDSKSALAHVRALWTAAMVAVLLVSTPVSAASVQCGAPTCTSNFSILDSTTGAEIGGGQLAYSAATGAISLDRLHNVRGGGLLDSAGGLKWDLGGGSSISVGSLNGNAADPTLNFSLSASSGATERTFLLDFVLPIASSGSFQASSFATYTLTAKTAAGAQLTPLSANLIVAREVDSSVGGLAPLDKGVDAGPALLLFALGSLHTTSSASNALTGDLRYDSMLVQVGFTLSPNAELALSGIVYQEPLVVPLPGALCLLLSGLAGFGVFSRRSRAG
jgi:hypothetical protein